MSICYVSKTTIWLALLAFIGIQLQGTLYNYYYVILRNKSVGGDAKSKTKKTEIDKIIALGNSFMSLSNISKGLV